MATDPLPLAQALIREGRVTGNGTALRDPGQKVAAGTALALHLPPPIPAEPRGDPAQQAPRARAEVEEARPRRSHSGRVPTLKQLASLLVDGVLTLPPYYRRGMYLDLLV